MIEQSTIARTVGRKLALLKQDSSSSRSWLAKLRKADFEELANFPNLWPLIYSDTADFDDLDDKSERAMLYSLILYARHRRNQQVEYASDRSSVGQVLQHGRSKASNVEAYDSKVLRLFSSNDLRTTVRRLNALLGQLPAGTLLDYQRLAADFYRLQAPYRTAIMKTWATDYYRRINSTNLERIES